jgi:TetR/AcrR family transcriptional regulator, regulator of autoinduction and epiphytic fitness
MAKPKHINDQVRRIRHDQIVEVANRLLAEKGYELMTIDEVAVQAGISKMGLYRYFASKELVAAAAMKRLQERAVAEMVRVSELPNLSPLARLKLMVRWALRTQFDGAMPSVPSQNSALTAVLMADREYMASLNDLAERLGEHIRQAQQAGEIRAGLAVELVLFTLFARACDPVAPVLKAAGHSFETIEAWVASTCFEGLAGAAPVVSPANAANPGEPTEPAQKGPAGKRRKPG